MSHYQLVVQPLGCSGRREEFEVLASRLKPVLQTVVSGASWPQGVLEQTLRF